MKGLKKFACSFIGRRAGAIGEFYRIHTEVEAEEFDGDGGLVEARIKLYEHWEHIQDLQIREIT